MTLPAAIRISAIVWLARWSTGVDVVVADKGYTGSSGATASAGTGVWYVEPEARDAAIASREKLGAGLTERSWMERALDHTPALQLLVDDSGVVSGAVAVQRKSGQVVQIEAAAVVLATGACAFQSKTLGCDFDTGDGALMAVEVGCRCRTRRPRW